MIANYPKLIAAPFTPMDQSGNLNLPMVEKLANSLIQNKVSGAFISGTTGEGPALLFEEKKELMEAWASYADEEIKKIFMVGGTSLPEMQALANQAASCGMDAVALLCPYFFRPKDVTALVEFFGELAASVPSLPVYYYHIPSITGGFFSMPEFLQRARSTIPNLAGIKYSHFDLFDFQRCRQIEEGAFDLLWGTDEALLSGLAAGAHGAVGSTYNYAAPLYHKMIHHFSKGEWEEAQRYQDQSVQMVALLQKYGGTEAGKAFMKIIGLDCGWFRSPLKPLSSTDHRSLEKDLEKIGFFEFCSAE